MATDIQKYGDAQNIITALDEKRRPTMLINRAYREGDHWQGGKAWGGPPVPTDIEGYAATVLSLEKDQAPIPLTEEITERFVTGLLGRELAFEAELVRELDEAKKPSTQEEEDLAALNEALQTFYEGRDGQSVLADVVTNYCSGRGTARFLMPPEALPTSQVDGQPVNIEDVKALTLVDACRYLHIEVPDWENAGVYTDPRSRKEYGLYLYTETVQVAQTQEKVNSSRAEVTYLDEGGRTVFRIIEDEKVTSEASYDCGGQIWIYQARTNKPLIGKPQQALQRKIDFLNYILPKNAQYAGFRERNFLGVEHPVDEGGNRTDPTVGPGRVAFWQPTFYRDAENNPRAAAAQLVISEPVDSGPIRDDIAHMKFQMLESCSQLHVLISGDATASAVSRVQARAEFADSLLKAKPKFEKLARDLFTTVLCMACQLASRNDLLERFKTEYRVRVDIKPNAGPLTPEERDVLIRLKDAGIISEETARVLNGIEDVSGELNKIQREADINVKDMTEKATLAGQFIINGTAPQVAYETAGFDTATAKKLAEPVAEGDGFPQVKTDEQVVKILVAQGMSEEEARGLVGGNTGGEDDA